MLRRLDYEPEAVIVATIGFGYVLQQGALSLYGPEARSVAAPFAFSIQLPWFGYSGYKLAVIAFAALLLAAVWLLLARTRIGLVMRATQWDRETATAFGIDTDRVYALVFGLGAGLAAIAAVLIVPISQAHYLMGADPLLLSFIIVIIGGLGSLRGTVDRRAPDRPLRRHHLGLLLADAGQDPRDPRSVAPWSCVFRPQGLFGRGARARRDSCAASRPAARLPAGEPRAGAGRRRRACDGRRAQRAPAVRGHMAPHPGLSPSPGRPA